MPEDNTPVGPCRCPETPHDHDWVRLRPQLSLAGGLMLSQILVDTVPTPVLMQGPEAIATYSAVRNANVTIELLVSEIEEWSFVDEDGKPVMVTRATVERLLPWGRGGMDLGTAILARLDEYLGPLPRSTRPSSGSGRTRATRRKTGPPSTSATPS